MAASEASARQVFFHPGLGKTGTTYLQYKFFPKIKDIHYIQRTKYHKATAIIEASSAQKHLVSREFDNQFDDEVDRFAADFPHAWPILVLRRHGSWMASQYRRATKNGLGITFDELVDIEHNQGRWDKKVLDFYPKIQKLEASFSHKPLVLFYDELKNAPHSFMGKMARFMGTTYNPNEVSLKNKHVSYNEKQLKLIRHVAMKTFRNWQKPDSQAARDRQRRLRKFLSHFVMYTYWLVPEGEWSSAPLIEPGKLEHIDKFYEGDWQKCLEYARANPLESLLHTPNII